MPAIDATILQALDHPQVFAGAFKGGSWDVWRSFLAALFGLPMDFDQVALYQRHTGRLTPPTKQFTEACLVIGRRGGKSRILALIAVYLATFKSYEEYLAPGEVATIAILAADRKQARTIFRYAIGLLRAAPPLAGMIADETTEGIRLTNGVVIEITTATFRGSRGYTYVAILADETAFWRTDEWAANPDIEIFRALRPGLASIPGAILLNASSPYRRAGELWTSYQRYFGKDDGRVLVWQADTIAMNPTVDRSVITEAYDTDPEAAASEYGAQFRTDLSNLLTRAVIDACIERGTYERPPSRHCRYQAFMDMSGGSGGDSATLAIGHREHGIPILDAIREVRPPFSPDAVVTEFTLVLKSYGLTTATADHWGGAWVDEAFRKVGLTVTPTAMFKSDIYLNVVPLLNAGRVMLLDHSRMINQFCALERRAGRNGHDTIDHPLRDHDDVANAVAGCLVNLSLGKQPMVINPNVLHSGAFRRSSGLAPPQGL